MFLAGCAAPTPGTPTAARQEPTSTTTTTTATVKYSPARLCDLLTSDEAEEFGGSSIGEPGNSIRDGHPQCQWTEATSLLIGFQKGTQSKDVQTGPDITNTPLTVDGLSAMQSRDLKPVELCQVLVDISPDSVIYASATQADDTGQYDMCDVANQLINIVLPRVKGR